MKKKRKQMGEEEKKSLDFKAGADLLNQENGCWL